MPSPVILACAAPRVLFSRIGRIARRVLFMLGFLVRLLGLWAMAGAVVALVIDGMRSIALQKIATTPLYLAWRNLSPASYSGARRWIESHASPAVWSTVEWTLGLPSWLVLLALGSALLILGAKRPRNRVRVSV
jgi:hypothetical protein